jgi:hypothetical protein
MCFFNANNVKLQITVKYFSLSLYPNLFSDEKTIQFND